MMDRFPRRKSIRSAPASADDVSLYEGFSEPKHWNTRRWKYLYGAQYGNKLPGREPMPQKTTWEMLDASQNDPLAAPYAGKVRPLEDGDKLRLRPINVSRNHILADSRIRIILDTVHKKLSNSTAPPFDETSASVQSLGTFLKALSGESEGAAQHARFVAAYRANPADKRALRRVINEACQGRRNIRFGDAQKNLGISNQFDPVVLNGRLDVNSMRIQLAVLGLAHHQLITYELATDSLTVVKDRTTGYDLTSTMLRRDGINAAIADRVIVDPFAPSANIGALARRRSIDVLYNPSAQATPRAPAREWHGSSVPTVSSVVDAETGSHEVARDLNPDPLPQPGRDLSPRSNVGETDARPARTRARRGISGR